MSRPPVEWPARLMAAYLALQVLWIVSVPWHHDRTFAWAPLHEQVRFAIEVRRDGRLLTDDEVGRRYRRGWHYDPSTREDWQLNELRRVQDVIEQTEQAHHDGARVTVRYRRNGGPAEEWRWPP